MSRNVGGLVVLAAVFGVGYYIGKTRARSGR